VSFHEPLRVTLVRTGLLALAVGFVAALLQHQPASWPLWTAFAVWFTFGGHWVEVFFLNSFSSRLAATRGAQVTGRVVTWLVGGTVLMIGARMTVSLLSTPAPRLPAWWLGGPAFIGLELLVHALSRLRGLLALALSIGAFALACSQGERPRAAAQPAFAFRSPVAGDTLVEGHTYTIRWVSVPARRINLGAAMGGHDKGYLLSNAPAGLDSLVWTVPVGFVTGFGPSSSDQMRLRLENADSTDQWVETGPFVITGVPRR